MVRTIFQLVALTIKQPVSGFRYVVKTISTPPSVLLECLLLAGILSALAMSLLSNLSPSIFPIMVSGLYSSPITLTAFQIITMIIFAGIILGAGKLFSGTATFSECLAATVWLQGFLLAIEATEGIMFLILPDPLLELIVAMLGFGLAAYLITYCIKAVHDFRSGFLIFLGLLAVVAVFVVLLPILLWFIEMGQE